MFSGSFIVEGFQDFASFRLREHLLPLGRVPSVAVVALTKLVPACRIRIQLVALGQHLVDFGKIRLAFLHLKSNGNLKQSK